MFWKPATVTALSLVLSAGALAGDVPQGGEGDLPVVPVSSLSEANESASEQQQVLQRQLEEAARLTAKADAGESEAHAGQPPQRQAQETINDDGSEPDVSDDIDPIVVPVKPGINEVVPVSVGHLNRLIVPFDDPQIRTTSAAHYEVHDNAIYVATDQTSPITMYVTSGQDERLALSLTLAPRRIAPVEITLEVEGELSFPSRRQFGSQQAERWEQSQPYVETIRSVMRTVAVGDIPQGYALSETDPEVNWRGCEQDGLSFSFDEGMVMVGHRMLVNIGVATNTSDRPVEFVESHCADHDVAAAAAWPRNLLHPGQQTEVYVVRLRDQQQEERDATQRRILVRD